MSRDVTGTKLYQHLPFPWITLVAWIGETANELSKYGHNNYFILNKELTKTFQKEQNINILPMNEIPEIEEIRSASEKQECRRVFVMKKALNLFPPVCERILRDEKSIEMMRAVKSTRHIDHILKYGGEYLKSPCQESRLYEFLMIDVLVPIFAAILFLIYLIYLSVKKCFSFCCKKKTKTD
uniref:Uncharacterized protein n=1 Tax=Octopus bimaculoides TaxID=37653 RepID=A0A0L8H0D0_OCTBM